MKAQVHQKWLAGLGAAAVKTFVVCWMVVFYAGLAVVTLAFYGVIKV